MPKTVVDGFARLDDDAQLKFLARMLVRVLRPVHDGLPPERRAIIGQRMDAAFDNENPAVEKFVARRQALGKSSDRVPILEDMEDYAQDMIAFLLDDSEWP